MAKDKKITIVAATQNPGKIREMNEILGALEIPVISRDEAGVPADFDVEETGDTFEENSLLKAKAIAELTGQPTMADDSGLCCDYLEGAPGVRSARWSGGGDEENNALLVRLSRQVPEEQRTARYVCVVTLAQPGGEVLQARGEVEGRICLSPKGTNGFGYDPYFVPTETGTPWGEARTFAEYTPEEKNAISHRGRALRALASQIRPWLSQLDATAKNR